jgi:methylaspartate mutase sigma subunit
VGKQDWQEVEKKFKDMGFNRVYPPGTMPDQFVADLKADFSLD